MSVHELIKRLGAMPRNADVVVVWDGAARSDVNLVWLSQDGEVVLCEYEEPVYYSGDRPVGAPSSAQEPYWTSEPEA
jgi:hypothetical protein